MGWLVGPIPGRYLRCDEMWEAVDFRFPNEEGHTEGGYVVLQAGRLMSAIPGKRGAGAVGGGGSEARSREKQVLRSGGWCWCMGRLLSAVTGRYDARMVGDFRRGEWRKECGGEW